MNHLHEPSYVDQKSATYVPRSSTRNPDLTLAAQILTTVLIPLILYYFSHQLPFWPEYTKRAVWETFVFLTPSQIIYAMDHVLPRLLSRGEEPQGTDRFQKEDFGNKVAKSEALKRLLHLDGQQSFIPAVGRVRSLSFGNVFNSRNEELPPGLGNWDNSCYQNSVIQGLSSLPTLKEFVDKNLEHGEGKEDMSTHEALRLISSKLNDENNNGKALWTPPALKSMSSWQQQDAQEYFSKVMDQLEKEAIKAWNAGKASGDLVAALQRIPIHGATIDKSEKTKSSKSLALGEELDEKLAIKRPQANPLEGLVAQRVGCMQCGYCEGLSLIPFTFLTLPLGGHYESDVRDCLDEYCALETIEGVECSRCSVLRVQGMLEKMIASTEQKEESSSEQTTPSAFLLSLKARLDDVNKALEENEFSENTLAKTLKISPKNRVSSTKSRQAVVARPPRSLVLHINRSVFNELTGALNKNLAAVRFPLRFDFSDWCLGNMAKTEDGPMVEKWEVDPSKSLLRSESEKPAKHQFYELKAAVTHQGRHENGHYIAYRKRPWKSSKPAEDEDGEIELKPQGYQDRWFRFSDETVSMVSEEQVLGQGGVFMLFYEAVDTESPSRNPVPEEVIREKMAGLEEFHEVSPSSGDEKPGSLISSSIDSGKAEATALPTPSDLNYQAVPILNLDHTDIPSSTDIHDPISNKILDNLSLKTATFESGYPSPPLSTC